MCFAMKEYLRITAHYMVLLFLSSACSSGDSSSSPEESELAIGTYTLVEISINPPQDINEDGNTTSNVLTELPCATGSLTLNNDATWTWSFADINVTPFINGNFKISCTSNTFTSSGSWQVQNNLLTLFDGFNSALFTVSNNKLTSTTGDDLPDFKNTVYERQL